MPAPEAEPAPSALAGWHEADLHVYEGFAHADCYKGMLDTPESAQHYAELNAFVSRHLAGTGSGGRALQ